MKLFQLKGMVLSAALLSIIALPAHAAAVPSGTLALSLQGHVYVNDVLTPAAAEGSLTFDRAGNGTGSRTLSAGGQLLTATLTCRVSKDNGDGTGELVCRTSELYLAAGNPIPFAVRDDYYSFVVVGKSMRLLFVTGVDPDAPEYSRPSTAGGIAVLSGIAE